MTQLNAQEIIALSHEITSKNKSYNDQKSALNKNSDADGADGLITYNKMLDHLAFGAHTFYEFEYLGNKWTMRLLGNKEDIDINAEIDKYQLDNKDYNDINVNRLKLVKRLVKALSPSPFKVDATQVNAIWSEKDLMMLHYNALIELNNRYMAFIEKATTDPELMTEEQILAMYEILKKKPEGWTGLNYWSLLQIAQWLGKSYGILHEQLKLD